MHINLSHHYGELFENKFAEKREERALDVCERWDCVSGFWRIIKKAQSRGPRKGTHKTGRRRLMEKGGRISVLSRERAEEMKSQKTTQKMLVC